MLRKHNERETLVFNVQKCSIHDGPGIRTLVFLKGCPMRCLWCANPESQEYGLEIAETESRCIGCNACMEECPRGCIVRREDGRGMIDRSRCDLCGVCTEACYARSKRFVGEARSVAELTEAIARDRTYYTNSGGGVTFSGGEPLTHPEFLLEAARSCKELGISVAVETCGYADYDDFAPALAYIDDIFFDVKHVDSQRHRQLTGKGNEKIIENLLKISASGHSMTVRVPVVPGCNDETENLEGIARLAASVPGVREVELLAYHALGEHKYAMLGREYPLKGLQTPSDETMYGYVDLMNKILHPAGKACRFEGKN